MHVCLRRHRDLRQDVSVSVLEFIAALKWPIFLLILVFLSAYAVKRSSAETRERLLAFVTRLSFRVKGGPVEVEALLADTEAEMKAAVAPDSALAAVVGGESAEPGQASPLITPESVGALRREVVEAVMRSSARWGWEMARSGNYLTLPNAVVRWSADGRPQIGLRSMVETVMHQYDLDRAREIRQQELHDKINLDHIHDADAEMREEYERDV